MLYDFLQQREAENQSLSETRKPENQNQKHQLSINTAKGQVDRVTEKQVADVAAKWPPMAARMRMQSAKEPAEEWNTTSTKAVLHLGALQIR